MKNTTKGGLAIFFLGLLVLYISSNFSKISKHNLKEDQPLNDKSNFLKSFIPNTFSSEIPVKKYDITKPVDLTTKQKNSEIENLSKKLDGILNRLSNIEKKAYKNDTKTIFHERSFIPGPFPPKFPMNPGIINGPEQFGVGPFPPIYPRAMPVPRYIRRIDPYNSFNRNMFEHQYPAKPIFQSFPKSFEETNMFNGIHDRIPMHIPTPPMPLNRKMMGNIPNHETGPLPGFIFDKRPYNIGKKEDLEDIFDISSFEESSFKSNIKYPMGMIGNEQLNNKHVIERRENKIGRNGMIGNDIFNRIGEKINEIKFENKFNEKVNSIKRLENKEGEKYDVMNKKGEKYDVMNKKGDKYDVMNKKGDKYDVMNKKGGKKLNKEGDKYDVMNKKGEKYDVMNKKGDKYDVMNKKGGKKLNKEEDKYEKEDEESFPEIVRISVFDNEEHANKFTDSIKNNTKPTMEGIEKSAILTMDSIKEMDKLKSKFDNHDPEAMKKAKEIFDIGIDPKIVSKILKEVDMGINENDMKINENDMKIKEDDMRIKEDDKRIKENDMKIKEDDMIIKENDMIIKEDDMIIKEDVRIDPKKEDDMRIDPKKDIDPKIYPKKDIDPKIYPKIIKDIDPKKDIDTKILKEENKNRKNEEKIENGNESKINNKINEEKKMIMIYYKKEE